MENDFKAKKVLLKNTQGDFLIPYTEPIKWGEITGTITDQIDLKNKFDSITNDIDDFVIESIRPIFGVRLNEQEPSDYSLLEVITEE